MVTVSILLEYSSLSALRSVTGYGICNIVKSVPIAINKSIDPSIKESIHQSILRHLVYLSINQFKSVIPINNYLVSHNYSNSSQNQCSTSGKNALFFISSI